MRHSINAIYDLKHLTDMELEILDNALRHILTSRQLTETERSNNVVSINNILAEHNFRQNFLWDDERNAVVMSINIKQ